MTTQDKLADAIAKAEQWTCLVCDEPEIERTILVALEALAEHDAQPAPAPVQVDGFVLTDDDRRELAKPGVIQADPAADGAGELPPLPKDPNVCMTGTGAEFAVYTMTDMRNYARATIAALQAQKSGEKLADTQRAIIEAAEARGYRLGIEEAQQPGAQAVAPYGWHCVWRGADGRADWDQFHPSNDPPPTKWDEPPHAIIPLFTRPQTPSIPEPSDEDVEAAWVAFQANIPGNTMRALLSNDRARLRERMGGAV